jgi:hypothetical protein
MRLTFDAARLPDWLRFDRRDVGVVLTVIAVWAVIAVSASLFLLRERSVFEMAEFVGHMLLEGLVVNFSMIAALKAAEKLPLQGWRRHLATAATGAIVTFAINGPSNYFLQWPWTSAALAFGITASPLAFLLYAMWQNAVVALIARAWLVKSHEEANASKLLARMRSEQMSVRRRLVEGRLKAIQARVDPLFFFDMLDAVQKTYTIDAARAEQLLDELTAFLRAALPRLRTASSTVDQECELASSFARLRVLAGLGKSRLDFDIEPSVGTASFPPGVLLPLVNELLYATADADSVRISFSTLAAGRATDRLATPSDGSHGEFARQTLVMQLTAPPNTPSKVCAGTRTLVGATANVRATLFDLFGANADLTSTALDGGVRTTVKVPYEPASA